MIFDLSFKNNEVKNNIENTHFNIKNISFQNDDIVIPHTILPYRRDGKFRCLPHQTEGLISVGGIDKWAKGETTAKNEKRYILEMQQGNINYKNDGINNMKYTYINTDIIFDKHKMINVKS
jgi:hypothetical protein